MCLRHDSVTVVHVSDTEVQVHCLCLSHWRVVLWLKALERRAANLVKVCSPKSVRDCQTQSPATPAVRCPGANLKPGPTVKVGQVFMSSWLTLSLTDSVQHGWVQCQLEPCSARAMSSAKQGSPARFPRTPYLFPNMPFQSLGYVVKSAVAVRVCPPSVHWQE